jgi:lipopolysaccharide export system ATP-binding protein
VGYVPQGPSILWDETVRGNLRVFTRIATRREPTPAGLGAAAERVALGDRLDLRAGLLSAGERRRLEVARALVANPALLVCDEPFAGIDPQGAAKLGDLLCEVAASGTAVLLADHHFAEALRVCTRAVLLVDGTIAAGGDGATTPREFADHPIVRERYLPQRG